MDTMLAYGSEQGFYEAAMFAVAEHRIRRKQVLGGLTHDYQIAA